jgi:hypothetical protein
MEAGEEVDVGGCLRCGQMVVGESKGRTMLTTCYGGRFLKRGCDARLGAHVERGASGTGLDSRAGQWRRGLRTGWAADVRGVE